MIEKAKDLIRIHEGYSSKPYADTVGKITIGYGRNLTDVGITLKEAEEMLSHDVGKAEQDVVALLSKGIYERLDDIRKVVLIDMAFNLGRNRLGGFKNMLAAVKNCDYQVAAIEMLDSKWAKQVGKRAIVLSIMMEEGL